MNKLNILQLGSPTGLFGAERWILALVKYLDKSKINVTIGAIKDDPVLEVPLCKESSSMGISTNIFESFGKFNLACVKQIRKFIIEHHVDILHSHGYKQDIIALLACKNTKCKIVSTPHGWSKKTDLKLIIYETINRLIFPFFDAVVPLSKELYNSCSKIPFLKKKLYLIENGVDIDEIKKTDHIADEVLKLKESGAFIIGYIGQLIKRKGLDILLRALKDIPITNWHLFLVGEGDEKANLMKMAKEFNIDKQVHFTGFKKDRLSYLKGFDVFVLPSTLEGIPRCLMEAGAMGKAMIASNIPGCTEIVKNYETGLLFSMGDNTSLKKTLLKLLQKKDLRHVICSKASTLVEEKFSAKRMAKEYEDLYFGII